MSAVYEVSHTSMATACGLLQSGDNVARIADSGPMSLVYGLGDEDVLRVEQATGLPGDELQSMTWMSWACCGSCACSGPNSCRPGRC